MGIRHYRVYPLTRLLAAGMTVDEIARHGGSVDGAHVVFALDDAGMNGLADRLSFVLRSPEYAEALREAQSRAGARARAGVVAEPLGAWPTWARLAYRIRRRGEIGVGDTVHRLTNANGRIPVGDLLVRLLKKLNIDCGCPRRQAEWNARFPYAP